MQTPAKADIQMFSFNSQVFSLSNSFSGIMIQTGSSVLTSCQVSMHSIWEQVLPVSHSTRLCFHVRTFFSLHVHMSHVGRSTTVHILQADLEQHHARLVFLNVDAFEVDDINSASHLWKLFRTQPQSCVSSDFYWVSRCRYLKVSETFWKCFFSPDCHLSFQIPHCDSLHWGL